MSDVSIGKPLSSLEHRDTIIFIGSSPFGITHTSLASQEPN